jgi:uncharacterized repeat protein (TIGR03806 family)
MQTTLDRTILSRPGSRPRQNDFTPDFAMTAQRSCVRRKSLIARIRLLLTAATGAGYLVAISAGKDTTGGPASRTAAPANRPLWTTSRVHGTPDPPDPYQTENAFPNLRFQEPLVLTSIPDRTRFVLAERRGKIFTFPDRSDARAELLIDLDRTIYGVAAHPRFATNGYLFVTSIVKENEKEISRLSRFVVDRSRGFRADVASESTVLEWPAGGHNGGCVRFGPDGFLYLATGDGSGWSDWFSTGQNIEDLLASILRIDVDRPAADKPYSIPADNPFVSHPKARPEIYSYGHRNVWKFSFDRAGRLWAGDVGQDLWEMLYLVEKGGNYGWSVNEGSHPFLPERPKGPTPILPPLVEHPHSDFRSITGGHVYEAAEPADLHGNYVYGDYDTGRIWGLKYDQGRVTRHRQLADTQLRVVDFAQDSQGRVLVLDFGSGTIQKLVPAPPPSDDEPDFPRRLSETGLFASTGKLVPAAGLIPYDVNAPLWSDGAIKERHLAIPGDSKIEFDTVTYPMPAPGWRFPDGTVLVKTFSLELEAGNPASRRRLETRILHHKRMLGPEQEFGAQVWRGYTYVWNDEQTDAELLDAKGLDRTFEIRDAAAPGGKREQVWHFPSRSECALCHTMSAKYVLGVNTLQMNRDFDYGHGETMNQLARLEQWGVFTDKLPQPPRELPNLSAPADRTAPLEQRVRSYLHANCSHCHRLWGGGLADFQLQADLPLEKLGILKARATRGDFGIPDAAIVVPGHPERSLLLHRMQRVGSGRMPHVASNVIDPEGVKLVEEWIRNLKAE